MFAARGFAIPWVDKFSPCGPLYYFFCTVEGSLLLLGTANKQKQKEPSCICTEQKQKEKEVQDFFLENFCTLFQHIREKMQDEIIQKQHRKQHQLILFLFAKAQMLFFICCFFSFKFCRTKSFPRLLERTNTLSPFCT